jgi:hypothetical protein
MWLKDGVEAEDTGNVDMWSNLLSAYLHDAHWASVARSVEVRGFDFVDLVAYGANNDVALAIPMYGGACRRSASHGIVLVKLLVVHLTRTQRSQA